MLCDSPLLGRRWVRVLPHAIDAILLASGLYLAVVFYDFPTADHPWITAKLIGLLAYVVLGTIALKRGRTKQMRLSAFIGSLLLFGYIVLVAVTKIPWPFDGATAKMACLAPLGRRGRGRSAMHSSRLRAINPMAENSRADRSETACPLT